LRWNQLSNVKFRFRLKFSRHLFWPYFFKGMSICYNWWKGLQKPLVYFYQICPIKSTKMAKKLGKGIHEWNKACLNSNIHLKKLNTPLKTQWIFYFLQIIFFPFYLSFFCYSIMLLWYIFDICLIVVGLLVKSLCSKKPCNSKMLLSFVTTGRILS